MRNATMGLSKKELFILDHALRYYTAREGAPEKDLQEENALLDKVNDGLKSIKYKGGVASTPKDLIKDGCILKNRYGFEFATFPSLGIDVCLNSEYSMQMETFNDDMTSVAGEDYDIMEISHNGEVLWERK